MILLNCEFSARELLEVEMDENAPITMDKAIGEDYNIAVIQVALVEKLVEIMLVTMGV